jgi:hypothetical protein
MNDYQELKASYVLEGKDYFGRKPIRACGSCSLCCKLIKVEPLNKPRGEWCKHCVPGKGCGIYADRPEACKLWMCEWLVNQRFGEEWFPARSKIVAWWTIEQEAGEVVKFIVDPAYPNRWREEPWHSQIRQIAGKGIQPGGLRWQVRVEVGSRAWIVLPTKEVETSSNWEGWSVCARR